MRCIKNCHRNPEFNIELCSTLCFTFPNSPVFIPPPPPPPPPSPLPPHPNTLLLLSFIATVTFVAAVIMLYLLIKKLITRTRSAQFHARPENPPDSESDGPVFFNHHIWHISTIGLQQSVIDSIAVFNYNNDEKLIDGSDCSICLGKFQRDESLRLLPKCNHAFHVPCIDTWLRSHKNCPLCRAPVVSESGDQNPIPVEPVAVAPPAVEGENRGDSRSLGRSVSMDDLRNSEEGCSSMANSSSKNGLYNVVKSISMKRFGSGRRKLKGIRHYRSQSSVLPL